MIRGLEKQLEALLSGSYCDVGVLEAIRQDMARLADAAITPSERIAIIDLIDRRAGQTAELGMRHLAKFFRELRDAKRSEFDAAYVLHLERSGRRSEARAYLDALPGLQDFVSMRDEISDLLLLDPNKRNLIFADSVGSFEAIIRSELANNPAGVLQQLRHLSSSTISVISTHWPDVAEQIRQHKREHKNF